MQGAEWISGEPQIEISLALTLIFSIIFLPSTSQRFIFRSRFIFIIFVLFILEFRFTLDNCLE